MTPFIPLPQGAQAEIGFSFAGKVVENRLWFFKDNPPIELVDLQGLADGLAAWYVDQMLPYLSSDIEFLGTVATKWDDHIGDLTTNSHVGLPGGTASKSYSANVAVRVNLRWPLEVRERMNCNFVPGIPDSALSLNTVDSTWANHVWDAYVNLVDLVRFWGPDMDWRWIVASQVDGGSFRTEQRFDECEGPVRPELFRVAQRRRRLT